MDHSKNIASQFFQKNNSSNSLSFPISPPNPLRSIFDIENLEEDEEREIETLLSVPHIFSKEKIGDDLKQLKSITAEVKNIRRQSILLVGERIYQAREILKNYGDGKGAFKRWLHMAFSTSRRTAYNALAYFDFYQSLPDDSCRFLLKKMPQKAVYILASRGGKIEVKVEIIRNYHGQKSEAIISAIQDHFPYLEIKKKKDKAYDYIEKITSLIKKIDKATLSERNKEALQKIAIKLELLLRKDSLISNL